MQLSLDIVPTSESTLIFMVMKCAICLIQSGCAQDFSLKQIGLLDFN